MEIQEKEYDLLESIRESYYELIMAVENKYPGENRHETALRLIREAQHPHNQAISADTKCRAGDQHKVVEAGQAKGCKICRDWNKAYGGACANCGRELPHST